MSFPGMGGGLPGMPGGGAAGNVDPNDPNAVQMVRGAPGASSVAQHADVWGMVAQQKTIKFMSEMQHNCFTKTAMSGVAGFGLGGVFGLFMASVRALCPGPHTAQTSQKAGGDS